MLKNLLSKAKDMAGQIASPENIAKAKEIAASTAVAAQKAATKATTQVQQQAQSRMQSVAQKHAHALASQHVSSALASSANAHIKRGTQIVDCTDAALLQKLQARTGAGQITIGGVPIADADEQQHILLCGAPGTGKSVELKKALRTIRGRGRGQRAVVYDVSGELVSMYYRPGIDHILNPLDARSETWNPWLDAEQFEYAALARSLIPDAKGQSDPFWSEAGRATLEALLMQCQTLDELVSTGLSAPLGDLAAVVRDAGFAGMIGPEKTFQSTRSTMSVYLRALAMLPNVQRDDAQAFSIRKWLESDDGSWLFLSVPSRGRDALRPLVSMWLDTVVRQAMALRPDPDRRIWLSLDELPSLQRIPSLAPALAEGRKFGLIGLLGVQAFGQLQESYGKELAGALWGLPKTRLYLRIADADTAETVSKELGDQQLRRETASSSNSTSTGHSSNHSGQGVSGGSSSNSSSSTSKSEQIVIERAVLPSQIAGLPDLYGYLRTGGSETIAKVKVDFAGLPRVGEQPGFVDQAPRQMPRYVAATDAETGAATAADATGQTSEAQAEPEELETNTDHVAEQEVSMEALMQQYNLDVERETQKFIAEYGPEFIATLDDDDIDAFAEILAERVDIMHSGAGMEG